jgi:hypothetical protein
MLAESYYCLLPFAEKLARVTRCVISVSRLQGAISPSIFVCFK